MTFTVTIFIHLYIICEANSHKPYLKGKNYNETKKYLVANTIVKKIHPNAL